MNSPLVLRKYADVAESRVRHPHRVAGHRISEWNRRREDSRRWTKRAKANLPDHRQLRRRRAVVAAEIAVPGQPGGQQVVPRRGQRRDDVDARRPDALRRARRDVEPHHRDRKERHRGRRRELHRQHVLEHALGALVVRGHREVGEPRRDRLRLVARRHAIEIALRQRRRIEEIRRRKVRKAGVVDPPLLVAQLQRPPVTQRDQRRGVDERGVRLRVGHLAIGAHVRRVERIGKRVEVEAEVRIDGVRAGERAVVEQRPRVFDVERAGLVVVVLLRPALDPHRVLGRGDAERQCPAPPHLVRAVVAVETVDQLGLWRKRRLVGDHVDRAGQRVRPVQQRARAADNLEPVDVVGRDQADLGTGAIGRLTRGVETLAVDEHQQTRRVEAAQPRPHAERSIPHRRHVHRVTQRIAGRQRVRLRDCFARQRLDTQRSLPDFARRPRRRDVDLGAQRAELELKRQRHGFFGAGQHDRPCRVGETSASDDDQIGAGDRRIKRVGAISAGEHDGLTPGSDVAQDDARTGKAGAGRIGNDAADGGRRGGRRADHQRGQKHTDFSQHNNHSRWARQDAIHRRWAIGRSGDGKASGDGRSREGSLLDRQGASASDLRTKTRTADALPSPDRAIARSPMRDEPLETS